MVMGLMGVVGLLGLSEVCEERDGSRHFEWSEA